MSKRVWVLLILVLSVGLIAAGCGEDDTADGDRPAVEEPASEDGGETGDTEGADVDADRIYEACLNMIEGTPAEAAGGPACENARDAFERCAEGAEGAGDQREAAIENCEAAAEQAIEVLEMAG